MSDLPKVSHYGTIKIGDLAFDGVVLEDGARGYVQSQVMQAIGFRRKNPGTQIRRFLADSAPKALDLLDNSGYELIQMPHGGRARFAPSGILTEIAAGVMEAAAEGRLHQKRQHLVKPSAQILRALAKTGEVALIDEATGYQYHREPDALQDLFSRLIRERYADWERRFTPDYYRALYTMLGWKYEGQTRHHPLIGWITNEYVYGAAFPTEVMAEVRARRGEGGEKLHQWLEDGGINVTVKQISAVELMASSSAGFDDFKNRCKVTFKVPGQLGFIFPAPEASH